MHDEHSAIEDQTAILRSDASATISEVRESFPPPVGLPAFSRSIEESKALLGVCARPLLFTPVRSVLGGAIQAPRAQSLSTRRSA